MNLSLSTRQNALFAVVATGAIGVPSVVVLYVADVILSKSDLTVFIQIWALINTIIVSITSPLIAYAPNLRMELSKDPVEFDNNFFMVSSITSLFIVIPIEMMLMRYFLGINTYAVYISTLLFTVLSVAFNVNNALLISKGKYFNYFVSTSVYCLTSTVGLLIFLQLGFGSIPSIMFIFSLGLAIGSANSMFHAARNFTPLGNRSFLLKVRYLNSLAKLLILVYITGASTLILNGPLIFGTRIGIDTFQLITLGVFTNISLVFYSVLNSFTSPIQTAFIANFNSHNFQNFKHLYIRTIIYYILCTVFITFFLTFSISFFANLYVNSSIEISAPLRVIFISGFGISTITALPRIGLMLVNDYRSLLKIWTIGLVTFFLSIFGSSDALLAVTVAQTISAFFILVFCHLALTKRIKHLSEKW